MQFLCTFRKTWWLSMLRRTFSKEQMRCRGCFFEEIKAIGVEKMHQILTEIDKNTKKSNFENYMQFLCNFAKPWWIRISKTFNKVQNGCQEGFLGNERSFIMKKKTNNLRPKMTITSKCTNFSRFHATFVKFLKISWIKTLNTLTTIDFVVQ